MCTGSRFVSVVHPKLGQSCPSLENHGRESSHVDVAAAMTFRTSPAHLPLRPPFAILGGPVVPEGGDNARQGVPTLIDGSAINRGFSPIPS
jgi:hypothetical protein